MASAKLLETYPPFPEKTPFAKILEISLAQLTLGSEIEAAKVFSACTTSGFFQLNLQDDKAGEKLLQDVETIFGIATDVMNLKTEEKIKYKQNPPHDFLGYKTLGFLKTEAGQPDRCEFYNVGQDDILGNVVRRDNVAPVQNNRQKFALFLKHAQPIISIILKTLDARLGLPSGTLGTLQPQDEASGSIVRLLRYPPQPSDDRRTALVSHTDIGTITLLSTVLGGLQILPQDATPEDNNWEYVRPIPNCLIVNIGDTMVEWTGRILRSSVHRVTFAPGDQALHPRLSVAYLVRGKMSATMKRLRGGLIPTAEEDGEESFNIGVKEWEKRKAAAIKAGTDCARSKGGRDLKALINGRIDA